MGFVLRVLRRMGVPERELDDAAQDVFLVVHRKLDTLAAASSLKGWLFGIANKVAMAKRRRAHARYEEPHADLDPLTSAENQTDEAGRFEARTLLTRAIDKLDDDKRAAFVLYELEGLSIQEIADAVACPLQTVYSRLRVARQLVRSDVERTLRVRAR